MTDVEFLGPDGPRPAAGDRSTRRVPEWFAPLLAVGGAVLAVVAPFSAAFRVIPSQTEDFSFTSFGYDGWGRYLRSGPDAGPGAITGQHEARLGVVFCVAAGLVLVGIMLWLGADRRGPRWGHTGSAFVMLGAGAVLAACGFTLLDVIAVRDSFRASLRSAVSGDSVTPSVRPTVTTHFGGLIWWSLASGAVLIAAVVLHALRARGWPAPVAPESVSRAAEHHDDELLGGR